MLINTASAAISLARELEQDGAKFYEGLSQRYPQSRDTFLAMARDNRKNVAQVQAAYYGVISDAIEGCFAFNINTEEFRLKTRLAEATTYVEDLGNALEIEDTMIKFYSEAAEQSRSLLADIPRTFDLIARKRSERTATLKSLQ